MEILWFAALIITNLIQGALNVYQLRSNRKEKEGIFDRYMCSSLGEHKYYKEEYKTDVKIKDEREKLKLDTLKNMTPEQKKRREAAKQF